MAQPTAALITAIDWVHSENLDGTLAGVAKAKAEIIEGLNGPLFAPLALKVLLSPHVNGQDIVWIDTPYGGALALEGREQRWNAALAFATVPQAHRDAAERALASLQAVPGRGTIEGLLIDGKQIWLVDDAYNASPASMQAAIIKLTGQPKGRKIAVVGAMAELANPLEHHKNLGKFLARQAIDMVAAVGLFNQEILSALPSSIQAVKLAEPGQVVPTLRPHFHAGDRILVKASNATGLSRVVKDLRAAAEGDQEI